MAQFTGDDLNAVLGLRVLDPQQILGQLLATTPVNLANSVRGDGAAFEAAVVNPPLDRDMCLGL
jgi:hypothetical protein